jgi:branched-chain amino acid transport system permease protein
MIVEVLQQMLNGLAIGSVYTLIALGLTVVFGILGIAHFAHGSVAMSGGYLTFLFVERFGVPFYPAMALAMMAGAVVGLLIERLAYRPVRDAPHINAFIIALGLTMMVEGLNLLLFGADQVVIQTPYRGVMDILGVAVAELRLQVILTTCVLIVVIAFLVQRTKTGKSIRAVAQNRNAAVLMGVNVNRVSAVVFAVSSALGAAGGSLVGALLAIAPGLGEGLAVKGFAVLILGGLGSIPGAIVGGLVLGASESLAAGFISSAYKDVIAFLVMIVVLLFRPEGLLGKR